MLERNSYKPEEIIMHCGYNCNENSDELMMFFLVRKQVSEFLALPKTPWFRMKIHESVPVRNRVFD